MNWKSDLRLDDLPPEERLEIACRDCGAHRYYTARELLERKAFEGAYLDQVESVLRCHRKRCFGAVRLYRVNLGDTEPFVGGMA